MKSPFRLLHLASLILLLPATLTLVQAQDEYAAVKKWESFDFAARAVTVTDISALSLDDLKLVRGIIFGKHGRVFKDPELARLETEADAANQDIKLAMARVERRWEDRP